VSPPLRQAASTLAAMRGRQSVLQKRFRFLSLIKKDVLLQLKNNLK
jgi:hypothetical protein